MNIPIHHERDGELIGHMTETANGRYAAYLYTDGDPEKPRKLGTFPDQRDARDRVRTVTTTERRKRRIQQEHQESQKRAAEKAKKANEQRKKREKAAQEEAERIKSRTITDVLSRARDRNKTAGTLWVLTVRLDDGTTATLWEVEPTDHTRALVYDEDFWGETEPTRHVYYEDALNEYKSLK